MAVRVRLTRVGSRRNPVWRVVVADQRSPRDGRVIETVGRYNPQRQPSEIVLDHDRLEHWISRGAQPSDTVRRLMQASVRERPPAAAAPRQSAPTPRPSGSDGASSSDGASEPDADGGTGERAEPDASAAPQAGSEPPDGSERGADADQESSSSGAAEEGTPVPTTEPPQEEGPAAEAPADEAPPGAAPAGPAPQAEDNA